MSLGVFADCGVVASKLLELLEHQEIAPTFAFHRNHRGRLDSFLLPNRKGGDLSDSAENGSRWVQTFKDDQVLFRIKPKHLFLTNPMVRASWLITNMKLARSYGGSRYCRYGPWRNVPRCKVRIIERHWGIEKVQSCYEAICTSW